MNDISLKQLEIFVAVVEYGGFTRAAEELFFNQSTVSAHISLLEQALGKELFVRSNRRHVRLTKEGEQVYPIARRILNDCAALRTLFSDADSAPVVALGASTVPGQYLVPSTTARSESAASTAASCCSKSRSSRAKRAPARTRACKTICARSASPTICCMSWRAWTIPRPSSRWSPAA